MEARGPKTVYEIREVFQAPLAFAYRWCTDYQSDDSNRSGETFRRKVLQRTARRVEYQDLDEKKDGWVWRHTIVTLRPPNGWNAHSEGNFRNFEIAYRLKALPDGTTEFHLRGVRQATDFGGKNPPKAKLERELHVMWGNYGKALARDYRASHPSRR
jgi:hypothetical protein